MQRMDESDGFQEEINELQNEILDKKNAFEIAQRLSNEALHVQKKAFRLLLQLATKFSSDEEIIKNLIAGCRSQWECVDICIADELEKNGNTEMALRIFPAEITNISNMGANRLQKIACTAISLKRFDQAFLCIDALFNVLTVENVGQIVSLAYLCHEKGLGNEAKFLWTRLRSVKEHKDVVERAYQRYQNGVSKKKTHESREQKLGVDHPPGWNAPAVSDEFFDQAKEIARSQNRDELPLLCDQNLEKNTDPGTVTFWINLSQYCALQQDLMSANRIWRIILQHVPEQTSSYLRFSQRFNVGEKSHEVSALITHAESNLSEYKKRPNKGRAPLRLKGISMDPRVLRNEISISGHADSVNGWLTAAGQYAASGQMEAAFKIWCEILKEEPSAMSAVTRALVRIARDCKSTVLVERLDMEKMLEQVPITSSLFLSVAKNIFDRSTKKAEIILRALIEKTPDNMGNRFALASFLLKEEKYQEAVDVWLPMKEEYANACARTAALLAQSQQIEYATTLFAAVAQISPSALIKHGYDYFLKLGMNDEICTCLEPLIPRGTETVIEDHQFLALKLFLQYPSTNQRALDVIRQLTATGALAKDRSQKISHISPIPESKRMTQMRDQDIEDYLLKHMPNLRRAGFFRILMEKQPFLDKPGKKTSKTARSVVSKTDRDNDSIEPFQRPKKKK